MDGFKKLPKMKTGGSVCEAVKKCGGGYMKKGGKYKEGGDVKQDKALIKKAFKQHDEAEHDKEPTEIKLKSGSRVKKEKGTVKKFAKGGSTGSSDVVKEKSKPSDGKDTIKKVKPTGDKKAKAESKAEAKPAFKGSDVEKEKSKAAGDKVGMVKVKPTGDKKADAPNKAAVKKAAKGKDAVDDIDGMKKGHAVKKHKAGGHIKHMADGALTAPILPPNIQQQLAIAQALQSAGQQAQQGMQSGQQAQQGMQSGQQAPQAAQVNPNAMNTTLNSPYGPNRLSSTQMQMANRAAATGANVPSSANQPPAYPYTANDVMNNQFSRSGLNNKAVDALLGSMAKRGMFSRTED